MFKTKYLIGPILLVAIFLGLWIWGSFGTRLDLSDELPMAAEQSPPQTPFMLGIANPWLKWNTENGTRAGYSLAAVEDGVFRYSIRHGVRDLETGAPIEADTRFRIASMTKPITATAAMILIERGEMTVSDPVSDYIPAFADITVWDPETNAPIPANTALTVEHLLTFTGGIGHSSETTEHPDLDRLWSETLSPLTSRTPLETRVNAMATLPLYNHPGEEWHYASSLTVLARVIEVVTGKPFEAVLKDEIFDPLGMSSTSFMSPPEERGDIATLYTHNADGDLVIRPDAAFDEKGRVSGDGRLVSTLPDYLRFALMLSNGGQFEGVRLLSEESIAEMITPRVDRGVLENFGIQGLGWGYGLAIVLDADASAMPDKTGDFFWAGVNGTHFWISPSDGTVFVYMTQYRAPPAETGRPRGSAIPYMIHGIVNQNM